MSIHDSILEHINTHQAGPCVFARHFDNINQEALEEFYRQAVENGTLSDIKIVAERSGYSLPTIPEIECGADSSDGISSVEKTEENEDTNKKPVTVVKSFEELRDLAFYESQQGK